MLCNKCGHEKHKHVHCGGQCVLCSCSQFVPPGDAEEYGDIPPPIGICNISDGSFRAAAEIEAATTISLPEKPEKSVYEPPPSDNEPYEWVNHPLHYGGDTTYEAIKVIEAHKLNFCLGQVLRYILRAGKKPGVSPLQDLDKAKWYLEREIKSLRSLSSTNSDDKRLHNEALEKDSPRDASQAKVHHGREDT